VVKRGDNEEQDSLVDFLGDLRAVEQGARIEGRQVGGVAAIGYRVGKRDADVAGVECKDRLFTAGMRVYVDPATSLPVRAERDVSLVVDGERRDGTVVMTDFEWNQVVDPALLAVAPPAGYRVLAEVTSPGPLPQEQIAAALRFYASQREGRLPDGIGAEGLERMHAELLEKLPEQDREQLRDASATKLHKLAIFWRQIGPILPLTTGLLEVGEDKVHYLGKGMQAGDGSKMVAWWKAERPGRAIAIFDDFSWKEIAEPAAAE
jgi:hypothetical protein